MYSTCNPRSVARIQKEKKNIHRKLTILRFFLKNRLLYSYFFFFLNKEWQSSVKTIICYYSLEMYSSDDFIFSTNEQNIGLG